ncbi:MAG TPA: thiamine pyrophosphate-dependent enzyme [Granulicella sp.]|nr:thiamine pyrophosphate-dependent enzyme [Granulicella sp.]
MTVATSKEPRAQAELNSTPFENPLIPNKKLRTLYTAMVELRLLEECVAGLQKKTKTAARLHTAPGEEACRVSTLIDIEPGDLTSDARLGVATEFLRGAKLPELLHHLQASNSRKPGSAILPENSAKNLPKLLPFLESGAQRLNVALGAALASKTFNGARSSRLVVAYAHTHDLSPSEWQQVLHLAGARSLPVILVALPPTTAGNGPGSSPGGLSRLATANGVPGIPVDAADPVALYRVAQESTQRARAGGGAVLMECIPFPALKTKQPADPIQTMERFLIERQVATPAWMEQVHHSFRQRIEAARR